VRSGTIDMIICASTFKHIWQADSMLDECARVLRPGGRLSIVDVTPSGIRLGVAAGYFMKGAVQRKPDLDGLCSLMTRHGFEVVQRERFMALPFRIPGMLVFETFLRRRGLDRLMFYQIACGRLPGRQEDTAVRSIPAQRLPGD
jgi:SAM-dependent methyltransferase